MGFIILGGIVLAIGAGLFFAQRHQNQRAFCVRVARSARIADLQQMAKAIAQDMGGGSWREYVKVSGEVVCDRPLTAPLSQQPCVHYKMQVQRDYEETVTQRDEDGNTTQETRKGSETMSSNEQSTPFYLRDDTGQLAIVLDGAEIETEKVVDEFRPDQGGQISFGSFSMSVGRPSTGRQTLGYRYRESVLPVQRRATIVGMVADVGDRLQLQKPADNDKHFLVAMRTAEAVTRAAEQQANTLRYIGFGCLALGGLFILIGLFNLV
jgi:hypothetical protein